MVGGYQDRKGVWHGYIWERGKKPVTLDDPEGNGTFTDAFGINYNGAIRVVGYYINSSGNSVGFLYNPKTKTKFTDITGPPGATSSWASEINDKGWIVGWYADSNGSTHGFLLQGTTYTYPLDVPSATATYAFGINNKGTINLSWINSSGAWGGLLQKTLARPTKYLTSPAPDLMVPKPPT